MKRRWMIVSSLLLGTIGLVWLGLALSGPANPVYGGHRLSYWVAVKPKPVAVTVSIFSGSMLLANNLFPLPSDPHLPQVDSNAVPYLVMSLNEHVGPIQKGYAIAWEKLPKPAQAHLPAPESPETVRINSARMLAGIGVIPPGAIEALANIATNSTNKINGHTVASSSVAMAALVQLSQDNRAAAMVLMQVAQSGTNRNMREGALMGLGATGAKYPEVIDLFLKLEQDPNWRNGVVSAALDSYVRGLGQTAQSDSDRATRLRALKEMRRVGEKLVKRNGGPFWNIINIATKEGDDEPVRLEALAMLKDMGGQDLVLPGSLEVTVARDKSPAIRRAAISTLLSLANADNAEARKSLIKGVAATDGGRCFGADAWAELESEPLFSEEASKQLQTIQGVYRRFQADSMRALTWNGAKSLGIPELIQILKTDTTDPYQYPNPRLAAVGLLQQTGNQNPEAIQALLEVVTNSPGTDAYLPVRMSALAALGQIGVGNSNAIAVLTSVAKDNSHAAIRVVAADALAAMSKPK